MNGYLVLLRCSFDDFPVRLFAEAALARAWAAAFDVEKDLADVAALVGMKIDPAALAYFTVVRFEGGVPSSVETVRAF